MLYWYAVWGHFHRSISIAIRGCVEQWSVHQTCNWWIAFRRELEFRQRPHCFLEQKTLPIILSTGCFQ